VIIFQPTDVYAKEIVSNRGSYSNVVKTFNISSFKLNYNVKKDFVSNKIDYKIFKYASSLNKQQLSEKFKGNALLSGENIEKTFTTADLAENNWEFIIW